jgi:hypothetical protein
MNRKRIFKIIIPSLIAFGLIVFLLNWFNTATLDIYAGQNAQIYVKQGGGNFLESGRGHFVYKTKSRDTVFIEARKGDAVTQKSVHPKKARKLSVDLELKELVQPRAIAPGPFLYPLVEGNYIYGIIKRKSS